MKRPWQIVRYLRLAEHVIRNRGVEGLGEDAAVKLAAAGRGPRGGLRAIREDVATLVELVRAWARGDYREVPLRAIVIIVAGVLYFVTPVDFIPDFIFGLGLLDDLTVLSWVISVVRDELDRFRRRPLDAEFSTVGLVRTTPVVFTGETT